MVFLQQLEIAAFPNSRFIFKRLGDRAYIIHYEEMAVDPASTLNVTAELCGLEASGAEIPPIGDDRGCGEPYREKIEGTIGADAS